MRACRFVLAIVLLLPFLPVGTGAAEAEVPPALEPWQGWAMHGEEYRACPLVAGQGGTERADFLCAWPGVLHIDAGAGGAGIRQAWQVDAESWVPLPGDAEHWPQEVTVDGRLVPVVDRKGPALRLAPGRHELRARIPWARRPQSLAVPAAVGLIALTLEGKAILPVQRDGDALTLGRAEGPAPEADSLQLRVYRRLSDGVPAMLATEIQFSVSGQVREELVGPALPEGFAPLAIDSVWPARMDADGRLRVRVAPGAATVTVEARATAPLDKAVAPSNAAPWPPQEIWSYQDAPRLRVTVPTGAIQVDPAQAQVPAEWSGLPAFALGAGAVLDIEERSRGLAADARNRLSLQREMWLDFDGGGWFARDRISGEMRAGWRLDTRAPFRLERAEAAPGGNAELLLVTQGAQADLRGVEWRTPQVDLSAGVRVEPANASLPVAGWQETFDGIDSTLHLPSGYRLLAAPGADRADGSWMSRWTLLDVFLAAVVALLAWKAFGRAAGIAAVFYLVLGYQEAGAPVWTLIAVCLLVLVVRELPIGRLRTACAWLRNAAMLLLVLVALPFVATQVRSAVYPQLEAATAPQTFVMVEFREPADRSRAVEEVAPMTLPPSPPAPPPPPAPAADLQQGGSGQNRLESVTVTGSRVRAQDLVERYSESTVLQTGAGEPSWTLGHRYSLGWTGPILPTQTVRLVIAPLWLVRSLRIVLVALLGFLLWRMAGAGRTWLRGSTGALAAVMALGVAAPLPANAQEFPPDALIGELHDRLAEAPECAPACASIALAEVRARGEAIDVVLQAHASTRVALPLPTDDSALALTEVRVDGVSHDLAARHRGRLWLSLERGVHRLELAYVAHADKAALAFPLTPKRVVFSGEGWDSSGLVEDRLQTETLGLARLRDGGEAAAIGSGAQQFVPFVRVTRELRLGLDWWVNTGVERLAPAEGGFTVAVPVLAGEHVATDVRVEGGSVLAALAADADTTHWQSDLDKAATLELTAPSLGDRAETWFVLVSPTWHVEFSGVPPVAPEASGTGDRDAWHAFEFHPLPGEQLRVAVTRPEPVQGASRAIDRVVLRHDVGKRATTGTLELSMRASQGGEQAITLPADAELLGVRRDGVPLNLRAVDGRLTLPLARGTQQFAVEFREAVPVAFRVATPPIALGAPAANIQLQMGLPQDRWLLATSGPVNGPAVLYWGELLVMLLVAFALSRLPRSPLRLWQWILLGLGFSTTSWLALGIVVAWLFALEWRRRAGVTSPLRFNLAQVGLAVFTLCALLALLDAIRHGLLAWPDMHVTGNGSSAHSLQWFADRSPDLLPVASVISLPLWIYRVAMLAWSLWLATALVSWLKRGFLAWSHDGYWRRWPRRARVETTPASPPEVPAE
ncbi:MAG: hypothetical protein J0H15_10305 [Xanthomonadales bacterium]|nr:hypothetical protein [Xanthomonadales bacterium]